MIGLQTEILTFYKEADMKTKRITALALCLVMLFTLLPAAALAEDGLPEEELLLEEELELLPEPELIPEELPEPLFDPLPEDPLLPEELDEALMLLDGEPIGVSGGDYTDPCMIDLVPNCDDGILGETKIAYIGAPFTPPDWTDKRSDYEHLGWSTSPSGLDFYPVNTSITPEGNMVLYAIWDDTVIVAGDFTAIFTPTSDGFYATITGYTGSASEITIPGVIAGITVTTIRDNAFKENTALTSVSLPDNVKSIGASAFSACTNLQSINLNRVTGIGESAFEGCASLQNADLTSLKGIGNRTFYQCSSLSTVSFGSVTSIGEYAFANCSALESVDLINIKSIGNSAFDSCGSLNSVYLKAVKLIDAEAFAHCDSLTDIYYNGTQAEWDTVEKGEGWNTGCPPEQVVHCHETAGDFTISYVSDGSVIITNYSGSATVLEIPGEIDGRPVTAIEGFAFNCNRRITSVTLPDSVTSIGHDTFSGCSALENINLSRVTSIGGYGFEGCTALESIDLSCVISLGQKAFAGCSSLKTLTMRDVRSVGETAFAGCSFTNVYYDFTSSHFLEIEGNSNLPWDRSYFLRCTVWFFYGHDIADVKVYPKKGEPLSAPDTLTDGNYIVTGWYKDEACTTPWDFADPVTGDMQLFAKWEEKSDVPVFMSHTLLLGGQIGVNFYLYLGGLTQEERNSAEMVFTVNGRKQTDRFDQNCTNPSTHEYYGFTCYITSVEMADKITAVLHYKDGRTVSQTYSASQYVQHVLENKNNYSSRAVALVSAIADYGHYVQPFLASTNDWEVGTDHAMMNAANSYHQVKVKDAKAAVSGYAIARDTGDTGIAEVKYSLNLQSETSIYLYLQPKAGFTESVTATEGGSKLTCVHLSDGRYRVTIPNIQAHQLGDTHTVAVSAGGEFTIKVSALSYVHTALNSSDPKFTNTDAQYAVSSLYYYYKATTDYQSNPNG